jgi:hypothetical protein
VDPYVHDIDEVSGAGRCCRKLCFSLSLLPCRAVFWLAGALGIGFVHYGVKDAWRGVVRACVVKGKGKASLQIRVSVGLLSGNLHKFT